MLLFYTSAYILHHPLTVYIAAGKVNVIRPFTNLSHTIGDNFSMSCNIEVGVNTAQLTEFIVSIDRVVVFDSRENISESLISYRHSRTHPVPLVYTTRNMTSYTFYPSNLTTDVVNFNIPYPEEVRGVKYSCTYYTIAGSTGIHASTITAIIPGFRKLINT